MPTYCFIDKETGQTQELVWTISEMEANTGPNFQYIDADGVVWDRDFATEHGSGSSNSSNWPMKSDSCGVHPSDTAKASEASVTMGVPTRFDKKTGQAIFESRGHRAKYLKARGFHDRNGGYSDG
jgi:hypothetical protein